MRSFFKPISTLIFSIAVLLLVHSCKKEELPTVSTSSATNITGTSASSGGIVISDGGADVTARGICWGLNANPSVSDQKTNDGSGTGQFVSNLTGLSGGSIYHIRAYATNSVGTAYGTDLSFTTLGKMPDCVTQPATNISASGATLNGTVNANYLSTTVTFEYGTTTGYGQTVTTTQSPVTGSNIINVNADISGLTAATTYHFRVKSTNAIGSANGNDLTFITSATLPTLTTTVASNITAYSATSGGNITSDGGASIIVKGVCWATSQNPTISNNKTTDGTGTGPFTSNIIGLNPGTTYYVRAYATNNIGTSYGSQISFPTPNIPSLSTTQPTVITLISAISGGSVTSDGGSTITSRGIVWSTSTGPTVALSTKTVEFGTTGSFSSTLTGLNSGVTYYLRSYATNSAGTGYGNELSFTTQREGTVADNDGNIYKTITLGNQTWFAENLKTTKFNDGTAIPNITNGNIWYATTTPAYCWYNDDIVNKNIYGALYIWYTVNPASNGGKNVCPAGWHVPTDQEWTNMELYLTNNGFGYGGSGKDVTKSLVFTSGWDNSDNEGAPGNNQYLNNITGFSALPAGGRMANNNNYIFSNGVGVDGNWWCAPINNEGTNWARQISWFYGEIIRDYQYKYFGLSIRCLKD